MFSRQAVHRTLRSGRTTQREAKKRRAKSRKGTVTVEMAMIAPVIFLLFFGSVEFARMMMVRQAMTNAARDGCRDACLASTQNSGTSEAVVRDALKGVIADASQTEDLTVDFSPSFQTAPESGTTITTTVEVDFDKISWLPPFFTAGAKISGTASMKRE